MRRPCHPDSIKNSQAEVTWETQGVGTGSWKVARGAETGRADGEGFVVRVVGRPEPGPWSHKCVRAKA